MRTQAIEKSLVLFLTRWIVLLALRHCYCVDLLQNIVYNVKLNFINKKLIYIFKYKLIFYDVDFVTLYFSSTFNNPYGTDVKACPKNCGIKNCSCIVILQKN